MQISQSLLVLPSFAVVLHVCHVVSDFRDKHFQISSDMLLQNMYVCSVNGVVEAVFLNCLDGTCGGQLKVFFWIQKNKCDLLELFLIFVLLCDKQARGLHSEK